MALFSRRDNDSQPDPLEALPADGVEDELREVPAEPGPAVGISVSSYRGAASVTVPPAAREPVAVPQTETIPGMPDNALLRDSLAALGSDPTPAELLAVTRQVLQGHLFLRVKGDAQTLLSEGKALPLAVQRRGADQYVLAYTSGRALQDSIRLDGDRGTSAVAQPVSALLRQFLAGPHAGIVVDPASAPASITLPRQLIEQAAASADPQLTVKTLLAGQRSDATAGEVARAMAEARLFVAVNSSDPDEAGASRMGLAESRSKDGTRMLELYTHPLEVIAMGRGDRALPFTPQQLARALRSDEGLSGVVVDAAGPWIALTRDDLAPVLALAD